MKIPTNNQLACMNMNFSYFTFGYFLDAVVSEEIENIELWGGAPHLYFPYLTSEERKNVSKQISSRDLKVVSYTPEALFYPYNIAAEQETMREKSIQFLKDNIRFAAELGAPQVLLIAGRGYYNKPAEEAWKRAVDSISKIVPVAQECDIMLMLEALQPTESNLVTDMQQVERMLNDVDSKYLQTMIDTVQMTVAGENIDMYFERFGSKIRHVHLTEGNPAGHLAWGDGNLPLERFLSDLARNNYERYLSLEIGGYDKNPAAALKRALSNVRRCINDIK